MICYSPYAGMTGFAFCGCEPDECDPSIAAAPTCVETALALGCLGFYLLLLGLL